MIISPEKILLDKDTDIYNKKIFFIFGNEETYIKKIEKEISLNIYKNKNKEITRMPKRLEINQKSTEPFLSNLFHKFKILIFYNPKDINFDFIKNINDQDLSIIICLTDQKNQNKLKKTFEKEKDCVVISCYKLSHEIKKLYFDNFLNKYEISLYLSLIIIIVYK